MSHVNPPPQLRIPKKIYQDPELRAFFERQQQILFQLWQRSGGADDYFAFDRNDNEIIRADETTGRFQSSQVTIDDDGNVIIPGALAVLLGISAVGDGSIGGDLSVAGDSSIGGSQVITSNLTAGGNLDITGTSILRDILNALVKVFIGGSTTPTALLHLAEGGTAAGSAPLKFTNGSLLSTPEPGAVEYVDGHYYFTTEENVRYAATMANSVKTSTTTITNTTTETAIFSKVFAVNELHADEIVEVVLSGSLTNASAADDFTLRFKYGGSTVHTISRVGGNVTDAGWEARVRVTIRTEGASGTYVDYFSYRESGLAGYAGADASTHSIDTTASGTLEVTFQWDAAKAGNTVSCTQGYIVFNH